MSVTESKAKTPAKTSKKVVKPAESAALKAALEAAQIEMVPLSALVKSPLNVRTIPYPPESVREMADSILAVGLIQNLVVHTLPDGLSGVAAGGRRLAALQLLQREQRIDAGHQVIVKRVSDELAVVASMVENNNRVAMHPAEQISGFRTLSEQGKTPAQIGDQLGYSSRHVQRMLKLASLAPELIALLAENTLDVEQCQALSLESDPARQVEIYQRVKAQHSYAPAHMLKRAITDTEISVRDARFMFVGREAYEAAGGEVREDLFSAQEGDGTADGVLVGRLVQEKLESAALAVEMQEGWSWSLAREGAVRNYGDDREHYLVLPEPEGELSADEQRRLDELYATQEATATYEDEAAIQVLIDEIEEAASIRAWTPEQKAACGVVVSLSDGELCIQRGVQKKVQAAVADAQESTVSQASIPDVAEGISVPLLKKMSSERTLAVQAELVRQPQKAVALMVWRLCSCVFHYCITTRHPFVMNLGVHHSSLTSEAPTGENGQAWQSLMQEKARLEAMLPEGWKNDFTTFFALDGQTLMSLMVFCTACSVDGVQTREHGHTSRSDLDGVEAALGFHLRNWWQPTADNFLGLLSKNQIVAALKDAGLTGAASDAEKMKKGDAASHAEQWLSGTRWVPGWMQSPDAATPEEADTTPDTDEPTSHAA
ncbi:ParB/RepB/Spo0J family partition protein [Klebsiella pneumoniae]|uniref:ParB/RepB/Spo0J family partition protein n=1 Tax=Klebsiella pneumoniae TaxID=573 RepID=UPI0025A3DDB9|nr:ParB/RepB/Spo0J family partition protein [Klebsiella pneumoniae]MDM8107345.1 ParB/RepB/Spo0J family partition protein [Klebsiella pneumoniae]HBW1245186.1 ParB/RepB/Spo0J family partition protein [Klebsiella pneumoniae]